MMQAVEAALSQFRQGLPGKNSQIELLGVTRLGIVRVSLTGPGRSERIKILLDVEASLRSQVPGVKFVLDEQ